jgi:hypothetical protein
MRDGIENKVLLAPHPAPLSRAGPGWRNWQTQRTQNPPRATSWGFDSPSRHQSKFLIMCKLQQCREPAARSVSVYWSLKGLNGGLSVHVGI